MKLTVEIEIEHHPETEDEREHYEVIEVRYNGEKIKPERSMDMSGAEYWPFFGDDSGFQLSVIADKG